MAKQKKNLHLSDALILHRYLLHQFGVTALEPLAEHLQSSHLEGLDTNNVSKFHHELVARLFGNERLPRQLLYEYDQNIVSHTLAISEHRGQLLHWKYFQYLALLFTEMYLDKYFRDREGLLRELNEYVDQFNDPFNAGVPNESDYPAPHFKAEELNKIAFWQATGSGKTLVMHVNIRQFQHYARKYGNGQQEINKVLLVTPNEGLSEQHLEEFRLSGIPAVVFSKQTGGAFSGTEVEVIEISKLAENSGDKTVAVEAFETNNLVLIDEGHRGVASDQWKERRDQLSRNGFAFEYSATFGQAVSASAGSKKKELLEEYGKSILFDYSYRYFYHDGYGKDYHILNIADTANEEFTRKYLSGSLLSFYQQQLIFRDNPGVAQHYLMEKPLWVFVGSSVNAVRTEQKRETSDVITIIRFFSDFIKDSETSKDHIAQIIGGRDGLLDANNISIFANAFTYIKSKNQSAEELYLDILKTVFNTANPGANVYLDNLKGAEGELGLRLGDTEDYFGVINVGDEGKLHRLCMEQGIAGMDKDFSDSLFQSINRPGSPINLLIGSKKFTEGWSSWRVSTMGLMNIGRGEGSQIIQLFGRGVRLKGYRFSLKRSSKLDQYQMPEKAVPAFIPALETLNVFGIRADYMQQFKQLLEDEGLPPNDGVFEKIVIPVMPTVNLAEHRLKVVKVRDGIDFKKDNILSLGLERFYDSPPVHLDWYPKVQVLDSARRAAPGPEALETHRLSMRNLAFVHWDEVYFELLKFKNERGWSNLSIHREALPQIMADSSWYVLHIPAVELELKSFRQTRIWQEIAVSLLKNYTDRYYNHHKQRYLGRFLEVKTLEPGDPNFIEEYQLFVERSQKDIIENLHKLKMALAQGTMEQEVRIGPDFSAFEFLQHLYKPLLYIQDKKYREIVKIQPVALNIGEKRFVDDLRRYYESHPDFFENRKLFLLRNMSRSGVGFFDAGNFYPDFILWLIEGERQYVAFIDPKGLRQVEGFDSPKIRFHQMLKTSIEPGLNDPLISLSSHIISATFYHQVRHWKDQQGMEDFNRRHVYFQEEQRGVYVGLVLEGMRGEVWVE
ncbi:MAG TPA: DEAD/DEAH box helicase family protein [Saprospiraceae bacterium]|nr:DEAD/DEAH box helicase family protein [Saprospiraceae bacterium]